MRLLNRVFVLKQKKTLGTVLENSVFTSLSVLFLSILKKVEMVYALVVYLSSYGCTWEVGRELEKPEKESTSPRATQTLLSCSVNFSRASITQGVKCPIFSYFLKNSYFFLLFSSFFRLSYYFFLKS